MALASRVGGLAATVVAARSFNTSESAWGKKGGIEVRVVSYNVLSDSLCDKGELGVAALAGGCEGRRGGRRARLGGHHWLRRGWGEW